MKQTVITYTVHSPKEAVWQALIQLSAQEGSSFSYEGRNDAQHSMDFRIHADETLRVLLLDEPKDSCKLQLTITAENCSLIEERFLSLLADRLRSCEADSNATLKQQKTMERTSQKDRWIGNNKVSLLLKLASLLFLLVGFLFSVHQALYSSSYFGIVQQQFDISIFTGFLLPFIFAALLLQGLAEIIRLLDISIQQKQD